MLVLLNSAPAVNTVEGFTLTFMFWFMDQLAHHCLNYSHVSVFKTHVSQVFKIKESNVPY